jgi:tRNA(fMet)-specific endonuclease VapC
MGTLLDTTVFIEVERVLRGLPAAAALEAASRQLEDALGAGEEVGIATITASELLHGVHRASPDHRPRREAFVEAVLAAFPSLPFDGLCARSHARLWADLVSSGTDIGPHDRLVAATAITAGSRVGTANVRYIERVRRLSVVEVNLDPPSAGQG